MNERSNDWYFEQLREKREQLERAQKAVAVGYLFMQMFKYAVVLAAVIALCVIAYKL